MSDEEKKAIESVKDMFKDVTIKDIDEQSITIYGVAMLDVIKVLTIIEKQSKEIEELKEKNEKIEYIRRSFDYCVKQKEKEAYIKGTNVADELCNKKWVDKIKAKIEEVNKDENASIPDFIEYAKEYATQKLQSLLEKE